MPSSDVEYWNNEVSPFTDAGTLYRINQNLFGTEYANANQGNGYGFNNGGGNGNGNSYGTDGNQGQR